MDADRFDTLIRSLVGRSFRRRLAATAGLALGAQLISGPFDSERIALANKGKGGGKKKKKKKKDNCGGPLPTCYGCQDPICKNGDYQCVETGVGVPCGELCCDYSETCCNEIPGASYCSVATPPCAACQTLCSKPDGDLCCSSTQVCCQGNTPQAQCKSIFEGC